MTEQHTFQPHRKWAYCKAVSGVQIDIFSYRCLCLLAIIVYYATFCVKLLVCFDALFIYSCRKKIRQSQEIHKEFWSYRRVKNSADFRPMICCLTNLNISSCKSPETLMYEFEMSLRLTAEYPSTNLHKNSVYCILTRSSKNDAKFKQYLLYLEGEWKKNQLEHLHLSPFIILVYPSILQTLRSFLIYPRGHFRYRNETQMSEGFHFVIVLV